MSEETLPGQATDTTPTAAPDETQHADANLAPDTQVDFSSTDAGNLVKPVILGTWLVAITSFEPVLNNEEGFVGRWRFNFTAAEDIVDSLGEKIPEGRNLGTFSLFVAPNDYNSLQSCVDQCKRVNVALNGIVVSLQDKGKKANEAWRALETHQKRPVYINVAGKATPILDADPRLYSQWNGTVVQAVFNAKKGQTNLSDILAKDTPRKAKKA